MDAQQLRQRGGMDPLQPQPRQRWIASSSAQDLWYEYRHSGDERLRNRLVMSYAPLVKFIAYRKAAELPASCDVEDLISCGLVELIAAIDRYDPEKGATLEQYAWTRIHGAVLDQLRKLDWAPRPVRRTQRQIEVAQREFGAVHRRRASADEIADMVGLTAEELRQHEQRLATADVMSLNEVVGREESDLNVERIDTLLSSDHRADPDRAAISIDAKARFRAAFDRLPQRQRQVAVLLYVKELTLREIGDLLGVSESRVCQIHSELRRSLRSSLGDHVELLSEAV
ncbi:MAG: FliA/WhiG family RNA polymerase sigma factor [Solirubrobacteraceae bacterium]|nr:FliA/WhiG family RNA polymerase sigma factor [Solirubrobacteraceae bacterium]